MVEQAECPQPARQSPEPRTGTYAQDGAQVLCREPCPSGEGRRVTVSPWAAVRTVGDGPESPRRGALRAVRREVRRASVSSPQGRAAGAWARTWRLRASVESYTPTATTPDSRAMPLRRAPQGSGAPALTWNSDGLCYRGAEAAPGRTPRPAGCPQAGPGTAGQAARRRRHGRRTCPGAAHRSSNRPAG